MHRLAVTAPGSYQTALGCERDWDPDCRPRLHDRNDDGVFTWSSLDVPAGEYEFKIVHGGSWQENYGQGGHRDGANLSLSVPGDGHLVTLTYALGDHQAVARAATEPSQDALHFARAIWVRRDLIAWPPGTIPDGTTAQELSFRLYAAPAGGLTVEAIAARSRSTHRGADVAEIPLRFVGPVEEAVLASHPHLRGYLGLAVPGHAVRRVRRLLCGQLAVSLSSAAVLLDVTGVQIAAVLDDVYAARAVSEQLGISFPGSGAPGRRRRRRVPRFRVWAPTAHRVDLLTWPAESAADAPLEQASRTEMSLNRASGVWQARAGEQNCRYLFAVHVVAPSTGTVTMNLVTDPYSVALTPNSGRSVAVDLNDAQWQPQQWRDTPAPALRAPVDSTIYELHIRDFSSSDALVTAAHRGSYLAFTEDGAGSRHLRALAQAGLNTVHLLPTFDITSVPEDRENQTREPSDLASYPPHSDAQQAAIAAIASRDAFNWGYDPWHFFAPEGSYATSTLAADGGQRVAQCRAMIGALHGMGLRVVLDQVYNHTTGSGQAATSVLDRIVPGYYHRLTDRGHVQHSTCCENTATEHAMMGKLMVDACALWARHYRIDGFRFDLMGHHSRHNMLAVRAALDELTVDRDGVDGTSMYLYGEGWNLGEVTDNARFIQATAGQLGGTGIGTFSDRLRDAVRGGRLFDADPRRQGFGSGAVTDPNRLELSNPSPADAAARLAGDTDLVMLGLAGNLADYPLTTTSGRRLPGDQVNFNGSPAGYASSPEEVVSYVDAHDNETLFDSLTWKLPVQTAMSDRVRMNTVSLATVLLAQTPASLHAGTDLLRSKSLDRNSYDSGDWFNRLDWTGVDNGFGHGLPMAGDNAATWDLARPLLARAELKPAPGDVATAGAAVRELLRLRFSTRLLRLGSAQAIKDHVRFPAAGTEHQHPGVIAMLIDDSQGSVEDVFDHVLVVFNARPDAVAQQMPGLSGYDLGLSPIQGTGCDEVVKAASWDRATGTAEVPGRTVAMFVSYRVVSSR